jgi:CubicO group peptidase (beta-lactamase class C family)
MSVLLGLLLLQAVPGAAWDEKTPADAGLVRGKLDALRDHVGGRGCVVRRGALVYSWGDTAKSADVASAATPVLSTLLMMAVQDGALGGVDARVSESEPRLTGKNAGITWRQLASQTSGYGLEEAPGAAWSHNDDALALYYDVLTGKVFRRPGTELLRERLAGPLQFQDPCSLEPRLTVSVRDFARFGLLILRGGAWGPKQIVSAPLAYLSISAPLPADLPPSSGKEGPRIDGQRTPGGGKSLTPAGPGYYCFSWWLNGIDGGRRQLFVDGPGDLVLASGDGGKRALWIVPSLDLVVSWNDSEIDDHDRSPGNPDSRMNRAVRLLVEAAK